MKLIGSKSIRVLSNGSLNICYKSFIKSQQFDFFEEDYTNLFLKKKKNNNTQIKSNYFSAPNNKYLNF